MIKARLAKRFVEDSRDPSGVVSRIPASPSMAKTRRSPARGSEKASLKSATRPQERPRKLTRQKHMHATKFETLILRRREYHVAINSIRHDGEALSKENSRACKLMNTMRG